MGPERIIMDLTHCVWRRRGGWGNSGPGPAQALGPAFWHKSLMFAGVPHTGGRSRFKIKMPDLLALL